MKTKRLLVLTASLAVVLACSVSMGAEPTPVPPIQQPPPPQQPVILPTYTPYPTFTSVPPVPNTQQPTAIPVLPSVTPARLPQEWSGFYNQTSVGKVGIQLLIEKMDENSFSGKMLWLPTKWYTLTITRMNGEYVLNFGDDFEQRRWSKHPDFNQGIENGTWLKWTETEMISGNSIFTMNGWYYAHIRSNGTMVGIYYFNATEVTPAADSYELKLK